MDGTPPTPETSVSLFVWAFVLATSLIVVPALVLVRRRHRLLQTLGVGLLTFLVLSAGGLYLIIPPTVPTGEHSRLLATCPYDRLIWSNMRVDIGAPWEPCRRVARIQLALTLMGASAVTVLAAAMALRRPNDPPPAIASQEQTEDRG